MIRFVGTWLLQLLVLLLMRIRWLTMPEEFTNNTPLIMENRCRLNSSSSTFVIWSKATLSMEVWDLLELVSCMQAGTRFTAINCTKVILVEIMVDGRPLALAGIYRLPNPFSKPIILKNWPWKNPSLWLSKSWPKLLKQTISTTKDVNICYSFILLNLNILFI